MWRLALRTLRLRKGGFIATFIAMFFGAAIVMACGGLMETGIRTAVPAQRLAAAPIVVTGDQTYQVPVQDSAEPRKPDKDLKTKSASMAERVRVDSGVVPRIQAVPGVTRAVAEVSFPATVLRAHRPMSADSLGHGWGSAGLTPYPLTSGTPPSKHGDVVLGAGVANASGLNPGDRVDLAIRGAGESFLVTGIAAPAGNPDLPTDSLPRRLDPTQPALFVTDSDATRLAGHPGKVDAVGGADRAGRGR